MRYARAKHNPAGYVRACLEEHYAQHPPGSTPPLPRSSESKQERDWAASNRIVTANPGPDVPVVKPPGGEPPSAPPNEAFKAAQAKLAQQLGTPKPERREPPPVLDPAKKRAVEAELEELRAKRNGNVVVTAQK